MLPVTEQAQTHKLLHQYKQIRDQSIRLTAPLNTEDYVVQPVVDVSPPKWHLAHTTWFFEEFILGPNLSGYKVFHKDYNFLFNSYYDSVGERVQRPNRGFMTRPTVEEILAYRSNVDEHMGKFLESVGEIGTELAYTIQLGLQHEQQHQELLLYDIKYILNQYPLFPKYSKDVVPAAQERKANFLSVEEGVYEIGHQEDGFCFDNELGCHKVYINSFEIMDRLVTNGEFLEFMASGAYNDFKHWLMEGWAWVNETNQEHPMHWYKLDGQWHYFSLAGGLVPLDLNAPVTHVSYYEADAFARWKGMRLPTEFEWEVAAKKYSPEIPASANLVDAQNFNPMGAGHDNYQFFGDTWEWTSSSYSAYPQFETANGAIGEYNGKFMVNQMVLRGGSCATPRDHIRHTYRNFFHPHLKWFFNGIRLAR